MQFNSELSEASNQKLIELKKLAQSESAEDQSKAQLKIGDHLFEVKDKGTSMFAYILEDRAFRIQLSRPSKSVPMAYIKISSEYLNHQLPADAEKSLRGLLEQLGSLHTVANVSRIDLYVDFVSHQDMEAWKRDAWVTRASTVNAYAIDQRFTGWAIGLGGVIAARLYDKLYEIGLSHKEYMIPLWQQSGWVEGDPVWRLEFEFKRELLQQKGLFTLMDTLNHLNGLWSYATTEWLKLTMPNPDDQTRSRWPIHPLWLLLASLDWETDPSPLQSRFTYTRTPNDKVLLDRAMHAFTSWMATNGLIDPQQGFKEFCLAVGKRIAHHAEYQNLFSEEFILQKVASKARRFNTIDVNQEIYEQYVNDEVEAYRKASDGE